MRAQNIMLKIDDASEDHLMHTTSVIGGVINYESQLLRSLT